MKDARRIIVKLGTALITRENEDGLAIGRLASTVEQVSQLQNEGRQMLLVTSGAVAFGRQVLRQEAMMTMTMRKSLSPKDILQNSRLAIQRQACAAFGQKGLMSFYERMFQQYNIGVAQVLVTKSDFYNADSRKNLQATLDELLNLNIIPILNTNDAVAPYTDTDAEVTAAKDAIVINDNDSLAARLAVLISADLLLIMSDVNGLYTGPPDVEGSRLLHTFCPKQDSQIIAFGARSKGGTGGMESKVKCASWALDHNVGVVISNGKIDKGILNIVDGKNIGTFFTKTPHQSVPIDVQAVKGMIKILLI
jgi:delta-1-pyrroline-5-carboxylate synthetase